MSLVMQAKPDFISVKVLIFIFIKCGFLFTSK
nr:MAG TPA: Wyosine base formation [Caudoviricetes sp.]